MEAQIEKFRTSGRVHLWRIQTDNRNYSGWHFTADSTGCYSLIELLDLMYSSPWSSRKRINLVIPKERQTSAAVVGCRFIGASSLFLKYLNVDDSIWQTTGTDAEVTILFSRDKLQLFRTALMRVLKGEGDFALGDSNDENLFNFWWYLPD